jgi:phospholipid/cholesterol/gamma-HCH transport system substrate-binding protein
MASETEAVTTSLGRVSASLEVTLARLERGEGTLGRLSVDETLYENISDAAASLDSLLTDVRTRPERYFRVRLF